MDRFEIIEKLRERADISYEEAREILEQANGDLLEAIVLLEKQGKLRQPEENTGAFTAQGNPSQDGTYESAANEAGHPDGSRSSGADTASAQRKKGAFRKAFHNAGSFLAHTAFHLSHEGRELVVMPTWTFALLMLFFWEVLVPVMLIALFFNVRYAFDDSEQAEALNDLCSKAGSFAEGFESGLRGEQ